MTTRGLPPELAELLVLLLPLVTGALTAPPSSRSSPFVTLSPSRLRVLRTEMVAGVCGRCREGDPLRDRTGDNCILETGAVCIESGVPRTLLGVPVLLRAPNGRPGRRFAAG